MLEASKPSSMKDTEREKKALRRGSICLSLPCERSSSPKDTTVVELSGVSSGVTPCDPVLLSRTAASLPRDDRRWDTLESALLARRLAKRCASDLLEGACRLESTLLSPSDERTSSIRSIAPGLCSLTKRWKCLPVFGFGGFPVFLCCCSSLMKVVSLLTGCDIERRPLCCCAVLDSVPPGSEGCPCETEESVSSADDARTASKRLLLRLAPPFVTVAVVVCLAIADATGWAFSAAGMIGSRRWAISRIVMF